MVLYLHGQKSFYEPDLLVDFSVKRKGVLDIVANGANVYLLLNSGELITEDGLVLFSGVDQVLKSDKSGRTYVVHDGQVSELFGRSVALMDGESVSELLSGKETDLVTTTSGRAILLDSKGIYGDYSSWEKINDNSFSLQLSNVVKIKPVFNWVCCAV